MLCDYCGKRYDEVAKVKWSDSKLRYHYYCEVCLIEVKYNVSKLPWKSELVEIQYVNKKKMS